LARGTDVSAPRPHWRGLKFGVDAGEVDTGQVDTGQLDMSQVADHELVGLD